MGWFSTIIRTKVGALFGGFWPKAALAFAVLSVTTIGVLRMENARLRKQVRTERLARLNAEALADTTRVVYEDSLRTVERLAVQRKIERDNLDKALQRETRVKANLSLQLAAAEQRASAPVMEDTAGVRTGKYVFTPDQALDSVVATVVLPPPPAPGQMSLRVTFKPIPIGVRMQCGEADKSGLRRGAVTVTAPPWAKMRLDTVTADPDVCSPPERGRKSGRGVLAGAVFGILGTLGTILLLP